VEGLTPQKITIKSIFQTNDNWLRYKASNPNLSKDTIAEVEKMLHCRDPDCGFLTYKCPRCGEIKTIPLTCKSRICTSCGKKHADEWADKLAQTLYPVTHRHMVFTIPQELREVLGKDHKLLKVLMDAVSQTMKRMVKGRHKAAPGIVAVLHPYGKVLNLNPHVHVLATEGGLTEKGEWVPVTYLEYRKLRKVYQYEFLTDLKSHMPKTHETSLLIDSLFKNNPKGFYVKAKRRVAGSKSRDVARYVGRYIRHPAIAESRIISFDTKANKVTFWYKHGDEGSRMVEEVEMPAMEFIGRLVKLIPDKNLKLIRYYGLYARRTRNRIQKILTPLSREKPKPQPRKEPVKCPKCGTPMELIAITRPS